MIKFILFNLSFLFLMVYATAPASSLEAAALKFEPNWSGCVKVFDGGMQANGQQLIRFYNGCPERLYINACVRSTEGEIKLYQSGRSIMTNGNFTIYTFPFVSPAQVVWSAGIGGAPIPKLCSSA